MAGASGTADWAGKMFSGENEDSMEYKRWKTWVVNKLLTLDSKVPKEARGAYVYTLLAGKALDCIEHLEPVEYQKEGGEQVIFQLLDSRFPQKDTSDEMSEVLTAVFNLRALEGESLKVWISRAGELFDRCKRKCKVDFPSEARGWLILNRSGLTEEQKAVILARSGGSLTKDEIGRAMRSCYPEFTVPKRRLVGVNLVETGDEPSVDDEDSDPLALEVEAFLAEHGEQSGEDPTEVFEESEVAEALAVSWKDKRKELGRLQRSRKFGAASDLRKSYRVEIEELKKKTRCHKCQQVGHWSRECRNSSKGKGRGSGAASSSKGSDSGVAMVESAEPFVENFIAAVANDWSSSERNVLDILRQRRAKEIDNSMSTSNSEILLVSSPGFGVIDSGCGRTIVGQETLSSFEPLWKARGISKPEPFSEVNHFKFGNGERETTAFSVKLPVIVAGRTGFIKAAIVKGSAPLLISRKALQTLQAVVDFGKNQLSLFQEQVTVPLQTNEAGQYVIDVLGPETSFSSTESLPQFEEVMMNQPPVDLPEPATPPSVLNESAKEADRLSCPGDGRQLQMWFRVDSFLDKTLTTGKQGPSWQSVKRRRVVNADTHEVLFDEWISPHRKKSFYRHDIPHEVLHVVTEFHFLPEEKAAAIESLPVHCMRQLESQVKEVAVGAQSDRSDTPLLVAEVFSPPRFAPLVEGIGGQCKSFDLTTGYDLSQPDVRAQVAAELKQNPPDLLILCPPCTDEGGWFNLNACTMDPKEYIRRVRRSRLFIRFCCQLFEQQVKAGGQALMEHPKGSRLWTYPEVQALLKDHFLLTCHMCRYGLRIPGQEHLIGKATHLLVTHDHMKCLAKECPGSSHPHHDCHQPIAGSSSVVGRISTFAGKYTPQFVEAVVDTVPKYVKLKQEVLAVCPQWTLQQQNEVLAAKPDLSEDRPEEELMKVIDKVHRNLGHPPTSDLVRILKHAKASEKAIQLAQKHTCDFCKAQVKPHVPLPAKSSRPQEFNQCVGLDVKNLNGWKPNQKIKALNIVDQASCYQLMIPFHERETSEVLRREFANHWVRIFGPPKEVIVDQAQTNLGEGFQGYLESIGCHVHQIAGEAHWQLGRTESHGGWFSRVLDKTMSEFPPTTQEEWESCVTHSHVKNSMIQSYGYTPHQHVFGKNPNIPSDLMSEPLHVVPATLGLSDEAVARAQAIRSAARLAVLQTQDDQALRRAFSARPRLQQQFRPGDLIAYWRAQKYQQGKVLLGGQWYGTAVVIGSIGKNYIIAHRRQIFRAAPEQMRPATSEERALVTTPNTELLGVKDMLEGGTFRSSQYIDLVPGLYPPMAPGPDRSTPDVSPEASPPSEKPRASSVDVPMEPTAETNVGSNDQPDKSPVPLEERNSPDQAMPEPAAASTSGPMVEPHDESTYGPMRRVPSKNGPASLYRPPTMREQDFVDMMREVVPRLIEQATQSGGQSLSSSSSTTATHVETHKRSHEGPESTEPPSSRQRVDTVSEVLSVEDVSALCQQFEDPNVSFEVMMASYLQKKTSKELPHSNNHPDLQSLIDESKRTEWSTIVDKQAVKIHYGKRAAKLLEAHPDRFIGSRFVITRKAADESRPIVDDDPSTYRVKSRWCLQGHLDPDLDRKVQDGLLQSPTLSQTGRMLVMQLISSFQWELQLGDIKGAFLEAGPLPTKFRPLFARLPPGGIPGLPREAVVEVVGNVYGQNDAPLAWHRTFDSEAVQIGWERSKFDPCLYFLREDSKLVGVMGVHVDDTALGGSGQKFQQAVKASRQRFPYRKWRIGQGEFCGAFYTQDPKSKTIKMSQSLFTDKLRPATIPKTASPEDLLSEAQVKVLRAINGSLNWLSSQSRPDLAVQTSLSQQAFPNPKIRHLRDANNAIRRAKMHKDLVISFEPISPENLCVCCHSDAAFANVGVHTQAGYILAFVDKSMHEGAVSPWTPVIWKSYRLPRAVSSTLGGEAQALATASGSVEWLNLLLAEAIDGSFAPSTCRSLLARRPAILATDCKSLYDHLISPSSPTAVDDRRTSIDIVIIRESIKLLSAQIRWLPTNRMIADGLTKDKVEPCDLLRSCVRAASYQISPEDHVLAQKAAERAIRAKNRVARSPVEEPSGGSDCSWEIPQTKE